MVLGFKISQTTQKLGTDIMYVKVGVPTHSTYQACGFIAGDSWYSEYSLGCRWGGGASTIAGRRTALSGKWAGIVFDERSGAIGDWVRFSYGFDIGSFSAKARKFMSQISRLRSSFGGLRPR